MILNLFWQLQTILGYFLLGYWSEEYFWPKGLWGFTSSQIPESLQCLLFTKAAAKFSRTQQQKLTVENYFPLRFIITDDYVIYHILSFCYKESLPNRHILNSRSDFFQWNVTISVACKVGACIHEVIKLWRHESTRIITTQSQTIRPSTNPPVFYDQRKGILYKADNHFRRVKSTGIKSCEVVRLSIKCKSYKTHGSYPMVEECHARLQSFQLHWRARI